MFIIYTKDKKPQVKFTVNLTREEVKELMQDNLFLDYPELNKEDFIIVEQEQVFKYPITDNTGIIREMTREELVEIGVEVSLEEGEVIKGNKIIKFAKPSKYHKWNGKEWTVDIGEVKENKRQELKTIRAIKIDEDIVVSGDPFQVKERDLNNLYNIKTIADLNPAIKTQKVTWILANNTAKEFTYEQIMNVLVAYIMRKQELFAKFTLLADKLEQATTIEEIENITWD